MKTRIVLAVLFLVGCAGAQTTLTGTNCITDTISRPTSLLAAPKPEPMDVPAEYVCKANIKPSEICPATDGLDPYVPTCADKRRVLLTSEDGRKHCILFPESQP